MNKICATAADAVSDLEGGQRFAVGGFGLSGVPFALINAVHELGIDDLEIVSNNCGTDGHGLDVLLTSNRIRRIVASYVGENREFARRYLSGELEVELIPQGTLAERLRAAGSGVPAFYTPAGAGTQIETGGLPWLYNGNGEVLRASPPRETRRFELDQFRGKYLLEAALPCDVGLVRAWRGDRFGNLIFRKSARNFNPLCAIASAMVIAEVEELSESALDPDSVHLPGIYVNRIVALPPELAGDKPIEKITLGEGS
ncbi:CoA transferase subunit A [Diaminobutyricibacter tongyongensis]|uniref:CoA transferase subunit A n=1 Tax=Leifsonia tongyongensis TaxID=1268043 RepID=A0A6L9Y312_9MICO|nr:CoA transferase subunit A [Diaminobutyricibacter tongyongensis]NEN07664.1 CoA transferase subunit A [Diaminobutyricibacter tongyongensis]